MAPRASAKGALRLAIGIKTTEKIAGCGRIATFVAGGCESFRLVDTGGGDGFPAAP
ncbi:MAG UNVERIFIED_CONTAM: hypothetical protein LVR18_48035 [Planctomycetaceae bacterium]